MTRIRPAALGLAGLILSQTLAAPAVDPGQVAARIVDARAAGDELRPSYSWTSRREVEREGELESVREEVIRRASDGQLQRVVLENEGQEPRRKRKARKARQTEEWVAGLLGLVDEYSIPSDEAMVGFVRKAAIGPAQSDDTLRIHGVDVVRTDDELTLWIETATGRIKNTKVRARYEGDTVWVEVRHARLDSGLDYVVRSVVSVPAREVRVTVTNFDYNRRGPLDLRP